jgi:hypothetical protein
VKKICDEAQQIMAGNGTARRRMEVDLVYHEIEKRRKRPWDVTHPLAMQALA